MWFECTFAFTMLEPWEKILCGEYAGETGESYWFLNDSVFSVGDHNSFPTRRHRFRPLLPPARQDDVR